MSSELPAVTTHGPLPEQQPSNLLEVIARAVANPLVDVEKMEKLLAMQERVVADQRKTAYFAAMARIAPLLPEIDKNGRVAFEGKGGNPGMDRRYARLEDIDRAIRPIISAEGLSLSFDTQPGEGGKIRVIGRLAHRDGHSETKQLDLPHDSSGAKNGIQAVGSTVSYGRRMIAKMFFNLMERGEDTDGNDPSTITEEQSRDIQAAVEGAGMNMARFCVYMGVGKVADILAKDYQKALTAIDAKRAGK